jgi:hypothetical protein
MAKSNARNARVNSQRFTYEHTLKSFKNNLFNCNSIEQREYINDKGEHKIWVQFNFANGSRSLPIDPTDEVMNLIDDFMSNTGEFKIQSEIPSNLRTDNPE